MTTRRYWPAVVAAVQASPDLALVGTAATIADALRLATAVDVLVCDIQLEGRAEGLAILDAVHDPAAAWPPAAGRRRSSSCRASSSRR